MISTRRASALRKLIHQSNQSRENEMSSARTFAILASLCLVPETALGVSLTYITSFDASADVEVFDEAADEFVITNVDPDGIAFDPATGTIFFVDDNLLVEAETDGTVINTFELEGLDFTTGNPTDDAEGLTLLPNGNLLIGIDFQDSASLDLPQVGD
ncbi:MAG: hypothetical protein AAGG79_06925, partial [Pseudomonadota bacterium]